MHSLLLNDGKCSRISSCYSPHLMCTILQLCHKVVLGGLGAHITAFVWLCTGKLKGHSTKMGFFKPSSKLLRFLPGSVCKGAETMKWL